jgi:hypothetical protein
MAQGARGVTEGFLFPKHRENEGTLEIWSHSTWESLLYDAITPSPSSKLE